MEEGFLRDQTYGAAEQAKWVEGRVQRSFWTGIVTRGREELPVISYRCEGCGFLESYARPKPDEE
jgi:hypothetical protein